MGTWGYTIVTSQGGGVSTPNGTISIPQMLNLVGQKGGELVVVVPGAPGVFEFIFKFARQAPEGVSDLLG